MKWFWSKFRFYKCIFEYKPLWCHWIWFWLISLQAPATKEQQRRLATLAVIFFTPIQEKAFFNVNLWIEKGKEIIISLWKICSSCMTPIDDQYTSLVTSSHTLWPLHQVDGRHKNWVDFGEICCAVLNIGVFSCPRPTIFPFVFICCVCLENFCLNCSH